MTRSFAYHRSLSPKLGVLLGLAMVETIVLHIVVMAVWGWKVAVPLALVDLSVIVLLIGLLRSFKAMPVTLEGRVLTMRTGRRVSITLDIDDIAGFRTSWDSDAIKRRTTLNLALIAWPNIVFDLKVPRKVRRRRIISTIAHRLDDPAAFHAAIASLEPGHGDRGF
ncbi:MAG TPA: hypothetical protein VGC28_06295 [Sphingomonas sp.]